MPTIAEANYQSQQQAEAEARARQAAAVKNAMMAEATRSGQLATARADEQGRWAAEVEMNRNREAALDRRHSESIAAQRDAAQIPLRAQEAAIAAERERASRGKKGFEDALFESLVGQKPVVQSGPTATTAVLAADPSKATAAPAPRQAYDMTGFNADVQDYAAKADAARASGQIPSFGNADLATSRSSTPNRAALAEVVKKQILAEAAPQGYQPPGASEWRAPMAAPAAATAPAGQDPWELAERAGIVPDSVKTQISKAEQLSAAAQRQADLRGSDPEKREAAGGAKVTPEERAVIDRNKSKLRREGKQEDYKTSDAGVLAAAEPQIAAIEDEIASNWLSLGDDDRKSVVRKATSTLEALRESGADDAQVEKLRQRIIRRITDAEAETKGGRKMAVNVAKGAIATTPLGGLASLIPGFYNTPEPAGIDPNKIR